MKKINIKGCAIILGIALLFSCIIYIKYKNNDKGTNEYYILQVGAYKNYDNVIKKTREYENYIIYEEDDLYKIFIGITKDNELYDKLSKIYANNSNTFKKVIKIRDEEFETKIKNYDKVINKTDDKTNLNIIIKEELKLLEKLLNKQEKIWYHMYDY